MLVTIVELILLDRMLNFLNVAQQHLSLELPLEVGVALECVRDYLVIISDRIGPFDSYTPILVDRIEGHFQIEDYDMDPAEILKPFFEKIYDEAGMERP